MKVPFIDSHGIIHPCGLLQWVKHVRMEGLTILIMYDRIKSLSRDFKGTIIFLFFYCLFCSYTCWEYSPDQDDVFNGKFLAIIMIVGAIALLVFFIISYQEMTKCLAELETQAYRRERQIENYENLLEYFVKFSEITENELMAAHDLIDELSQKAADQDQ